MYIHVLRDAGRSNSSAMMIALMTFADGGWRRREDVTGIWMGVLACAMGS